MANSRKLGLLNPPLGECRIPARTCGPLGVFDQGDPNVTSLLGDTPGPLGWNDLGRVDLPLWTPMAQSAAICRTAAGVALATALSAQIDDGKVRNSVTSFSLSAAAEKLLQEIESLRIKPYDDQTGKAITSWVAGATIGYGHLIHKNDWNTYKDGITEPAAASKLLDDDLSPFVSKVQSAIKVKVSQNEFDAMVILAFNIGPAFAQSSVAKLINDSTTKTSYVNLETAWKAWNKSQGKVMEGLNKRRQCEWDIYDKAIYRRW